MGVLAWELRRQWRHPWLIASAWSYALACVVMHCSELLVTHCSELLLGVALELDWLVANLTALSSNNHWAVWACASWEVVWPWPCNSPLKFGLDRCCTVIVGCEFWLHVAWSVGFWHCPCVRACVSTAASWLAWWWSWWVLSELSLFY